MQVEIPVYEDRLADPVRTIRIRRGSRRGIWREQEKTSPKPAGSFQSSCSCMGMGGSGKRGGCGKKKHRKPMRKKRRGRKKM